MKRDGLNTQEKFGEHTESFIAKTRPGVGNGDRCRRCRKSFADKPPSLKAQCRWKRPQRLSTMTPSVRRTAIRKKASVVNIAATPPAVPMPRQIFTCSATISSPPNLGDDAANFASCRSCLRQVMNAPHL